MATKISKRSSLLVSFAIPITLLLAIGSAQSSNDLNPICQSPTPPHILPIYKEDILQLQFAQNLEHVECDFFLFGAFGYGLDKLAPNLTFGGPPPIGAQKANLDPFTQSIIEEFGYEEIGHLRALKTTVGGIKRPLINLSAENFGKMVNLAFGYKVEPPFDPYRDSLSFMMAVYMLPYLGVNTYVAANPQIQGTMAKKLLVGLLGVEASQSAINRMYLYERANQVVHPYNFTVGKYTNRISMLTNKLGMCGIKDEGVVVPPELGPEGRTSTNVIASDMNELSYPRTPRETLRIMYGTGDEHTPGGFYPRGANGDIARKYLNLNKPEV